MQAAVRASGSHRGSSLNARCEPKPDKALCNRVVYASVFVWMMLRYSKDVKPINYAAVVQILWLHFIVYVVPVYTCAKWGIVYDL